MRDIVLEFVIVIPIVLVLITLIIIIIPSRIKRRIPFCSNCNLGKFWFKREDEEKVFICKKCNTSMKWVEYPEDMFQRRVKYFRIIFSLFYPTILSLFLFLVTISLWPLFLILGLMGNLIVGGIILDLVSRKEILKWAEKQGNL
ncbi:MAG: hypothetical protein HWN66_01190 [Candidatus Helarchaeota archaeon]|nr:hypothetical protein [Candidatus Helarchaeota archaeon]